METGFGGEERAANGALAGTGVARLPLAIALGAVGAALGAGVWVATAILADVEVGYIAVCVGFLAGAGVLLGSKGARGKTFQLIAVDCALFGLVLGKYLTLAIIVQRIIEKKSGAPAAFGMFSAKMFEIFGENFSVLLSPFDLLWVALAVGTAWRIPAAGPGGGLQAGRRALGPGGLMGDNPDEAEAARKALFERRKKMLRRGLGKDKPEAGPPESGPSPAGSPPAR